MQFPEQVTLHYRPPAQKRLTRRQPLIPRRHFFFNEASDWKTRNSPWIANVEGKDRQKKNIKTAKIAVF